jgi:hypothetical protein
MEGFGFGFHEGWLAGKAVIGRRLPYVCADFERNGLRLDHMYKKMWVKLGWIKNAEKRLFRLYYGDVNALRKKQGLSPIARKTVQRYVSSVKFYKVDKSKCIDFKDLSLEMQLEAITSVFSSEENAEEFIRINPVIKKMYGMLQKKPLELIDHNKRVVIQKYGLHAKAKRLAKLFLIGKNHYLRKIKQGRVNNRKVIAKYLHLDYIRPLTVD